MSSFHDTISFNTKGNCDIVDITRYVEVCIEKSKMTSGICTIFCKGSTGAITTIEYEEGLLKDFPEAMEKIAPQNDEYAHNLRWGDGNGHSHIRASIVGPSLTIPFVNGKLTLGTWQQVIFIDYDNRPRNRILEVMTLGE